MPQLSATDWIDLVSGHQTSVSLRTQVQPEGLRLCWSFRHKSSLELIWRDASDWQVPLELRPGPIAQGWVQRQEADPHRRERCLILMPEHKLLILSWSSMNPPKPNTARRISQTLVATDRQTTFRAFGKPAETGQAFSISRPGGRSLQILPIVGDFAQGPASSGAESALPGQPDSVGSFRWWATLISWDQARRRRQWELAPICVTGLAKSPAPFPAFGVRLRWGQSLNLAISLRDSQTTEEPMLFLGQRTKARFWLGWLDPKTELIPLFVLGSER